MIYIKNKLASLRKIPQAMKHPESKQTHNPFMGIVFMILGALFLHSLMPSVSIW